MTSGTGRLTREARRNAILDAASAVFGAKGFDASRMEDVAAEAGIAKGLLYKHFPSKDALFEALGHGLGVWMRQVADDEAAFRLTDPGMHDAYDGLRDRMREVIAEAVVAAEPGVDPRIAWLLAAAVQGAAEAVGLAWRHQSDAVSHDEAQALLTMFCWGGLSGLRTAVAGDGEGPAPAG